MARISKEVVPYAAKNLRSQNNEKIEQCFIDVARIGKWRLSEADFAEGGWYIVAVAGIKNETTMAYYGSKVRAQEVFNDIYYQIQTGDIGGYDLPEDNPSPSGDKKVIFPND